MHEALAGLVDTADLAVAAVREVAGEDVLDSVARLVADARTRLDYPEDALVVALAGGTGSGKSSLFNAVVGDDIAPVGELRPTTSEPMAAVPRRHAGAFDGYLDLLGIDQRVGHAEPDICLIDLPDTDSVVTANRHRVEEVMPRIDVLIWVVDPEKYRDAALHHRYLRPLAGYSSQFVFVLNQVDRLSSTDIDLVVDDLRAALGEDGILRPTILVTSVAPNLAAAGVDELLAALRHLAGHRHTLYRKLVADLGRVATDLEKAVGRPIGYRDLMGPAVEEAARLMARNDRHGAVETLGRFSEEVAAQVGGVPSRRIMEWSASLPEDVARAMEAIPSPRPRPWWQRRPTDPEDPEIVAAARRQAQMILGPMTVVVTERARALAQVVELAVGAARLELLVSAPSGPSAAPNVG